MGITRRVSYWSMVAALSLAFSAASIFMLFELRRDTWTAANASAQNVLTILSHDIQSTFKACDSILKSVIRAAQNPGFSNLNPETQQMLLLNSQVMEPAFLGLVALSPLGRVERLIGWKGDSIDQSAIEEIIRRTPTTDISEPTISGPFQITSSMPHLLLSRPVHNERGRLSGFVVAKIDLNYFRAVFEQAQLSSGDAINLISRNGILLMRNPYITDQIGRSLISTDAMKRYQTEISGTFSAVAAVDGVTRIYNFQAVAGFPLILNVALSKHRVFATWYFQAAIVLAVLTLLCLLSLLLAFIVRRAFQQQRAAETSLKAREALYRLLADNATDLIVRLDTNLVRRFVSPSSEDMLGLLPEELLNKTAQAIIHPDDWPIVQQMVNEARNSSSGVEATYRLRHRSGHYIWVEGRYKYVSHDEGFIVVLRDISKRKAAELKLEQAYTALELRADTDGLTGLYNRRYFNEAFDRTYLKAKTANYELSLLLVDVDHFKQFNDHYGHQAGDECLRTIAQVIGAKSGKDSICARYGGEEFALLLPDTDRSTAHQRGDDIRIAIKALALPHSSNAGGFATISIGCATLAHNDQCDPIALLREADRHLYEAKRLGRDCVVSAAPIMQLEKPIIGNDTLYDPSTLKTSRKSILSRHGNKLDRIARRAAHLLRAPIGFITFQHENELVLVGKHGIDDDVIPSNVSFCRYTMKGFEPLIVDDLSSDPRFSCNPFVKGDKGLNYYAGAPVTNPQSGKVIGTICVADHDARISTSLSDRKILRDLALLVADEFK